MSIVALYNPVCGDSSAKSFFEDSVLPLFSDVSTVLVTEKPNHAGPLLVEHIEAAKGQLTVILGSGDGTLHEIINHLSLAELKGADGEPLLISIRFVLVPCGTANALYSSLFPPQDPPEPAYKLKGVHSFLTSSKLIPLTIAITTLSFPPPQKKQPTVVISAVVVSTSLHASILHDSELLRPAHPGLERYKLAAEKNSTRWYNAHLKLFPTTSGLVQLYNPLTHAFEEHDESDEDSPIVDLYGPFAYFVATVNVDRLEPAFRVTPLARALPTESASCDVIIIRPFRSPVIDMDSQETRAAFKDILWAVMGGAYQNGSHIELQYQEDGSTGLGGDGLFVVEYVRCGGWEWVPDDVDERAHLLCSDGAISQIPQGGRAVCSAATPKGGAGFMVYA